MNGTSTIEAMFGPHGGFILASYAITLLVVAGLILWILLDRATQARRMADLESRGHRRRSAARASETSEQS